MKLKKKKNAYPKGSAIEWIKQKRISYKCCVYELLEILKFLKIDLDKCGNGKIASSDSPILRIVSRREISLKSW